MKNTAFIVLLILIVSTPLSAKKIRVAVMDFVPQDISKATAIKISELIRNEMINIGRFTVVERNRMGAIFKEQGLQQTGCTDTSCAVQAGRLLSARKILVGTIMKLGSKIYITGRIIDVENGTAEFSEKSSADNEDDIGAAVYNFTKRLSARITGEKVEPEPLSTKKWNVAQGTFNISATELEGTGDVNYIWTQKKYTDFKTTFIAVKSVRSDFRFNLGSTSTRGTRRKAIFYQVLIPWESGDSRVDYFYNGRIKHVKTGLKNILQEKYSVTIQVKNRHFRCWIDNRLLIDITLKKYSGGFIGFASYEGIKIKNCIIK